MKIQTIRGEMDETLLVKVVDGGIVRYFLNGELVHESRTIELKGISAEATARRL